MIPLVSPTITPKDRNALAAFAWSDGMTDERTVRRFEEAFAARVGCAGAVAVCSGTAALGLVLEAIPDEPTVPSYSCSAMFNAVVGTDNASWNYIAENRLVDSTFDVRSARMTQVGAAVVVHAFGRPTAVGNATVEDWTLSFGSGWQTCRVGVCSTHASKMLSTGRGGVVFSNDTALLTEVRETAYYDLKPNGLLGCHSFGMTSLQAALGLSQLAQLEDFIQRRREIASFYSRRFEQAGIECPDSDCGSVFFRYLIGVDDPAGKVAALAEHGIEAGRGVYPPLHRQLGVPDDQFPGATACVNRLLSVPCHPSLSRKTVAYVAEKVLEVCA